MNLQGFLVTGPRRPIARAVPLFVLLALGFLLFPSSGRDDSHITYWESHTLVRMGSIVNGNGVPLEQSSSLLLVLLLAALHALTTISLPTLGAIVSIAFAALSVRRCVRVARVLDPELEWPIWLLVPMIPSLIFWAYSGMETTLVAFLLLGLMEATYRCAMGETERAWLPAIGWIAALLLARPESPFTLALSLGASAVVFALARESARAKRMLVLVAAVLAMTAILLAWRRHTFGSFFPLPTEAKTERGKGMIVRGILYVLREGCGAAGVLVIAMGLRAATWIRNPKSAFDHPMRALIHVFGAVQLSFVATAGGDWMEGGRFFVAMTPLATLSVVDFLHHRAWRSWGIAAIALLHAYGVVALAIRFDGMLWRFPTPDPLLNKGYSFFETHNFERRNFLLAMPAAEKAIADVRARTGRPAVLLSKYAGVPFYYLARDHFGEVELLDFQGLATAHFTRCALTRSMRHDYLGVRIPYETYLERREEFKRVCGVPEPDIIFDGYYASLDVGREQVLERFGYRIVAKIPDEHLKGVGLFVAVRDVTR